MLCQRASTAGRSECPFFFVDLARGKSPAIDLQSHVRQHRKKPCGDIIPYGSLKIVGQRTCLAAIMPSNAAGVDHLLQCIHLLLAMQLRNSCLPAGRGISKSSVHAPLNGKPRAHATESMHMHSEDSTHTRLSLIRFRGTKTNGEIRADTPPASCRACIYRSGQLQFPGVDL